MGRAEEIACSESVSSPAWSSEFHLQNTCLKPGRGGRCLQSQHWGGKARWIPVAWWPLGRFQTTERLFQTPKWTTSWWMEPTSSSFLYSPPCKRSHTLTGAHTHIKTGNYSCWLSMMAPTISEIKAIKRGHMLHKDTLWNKLARVSKLL